MKRNKVTFLLFASLMAMTLIPLGGAYLQINDVLNSSFAMSRDSETIEALEIGQNALKELAKKSPAEEIKFREQFMQIQNLKLGLVENDLLKQRFVSSFSSYFFAGFAMVVLISLALALLLSAKVSAAYGRNLAELVQERERSRFLEGLGHWQEVAKQLAHEIKGPLQPIKVWMKNLIDVYSDLQSDTNFRPLLQEATSSINEEVNQLQTLVNSFTQFSRLPEITPQEMDLGIFIRDFKDRYHDVWSVGWELSLADHAISISADPNLLRQVLTNLMNNAIEANSGIRINVKISVLAQNELAELIFENSGAVIDPAIQKSLFEPYFTTKSSSANFGLGLSIVRKIILEHGGDIVVEPCTTGAKFKIHLPLSGEKIG